VKLIKSLFGVIKMPRIYSGNSLSLVSGAQIKATIPRMYTQAIRLAPARKLSAVDK
jgi:hypothetical protein